MQSPITQNITIWQLELMYIAMYDNCLIMLFNCYYINNSSTEIKVAIKYAIACEGTQTGYLSNRSWPHRETNLLG